VGSVDDPRLAPRGARRNVESEMISRYVDRALRRARYVEIEGGAYCGTVAGLRGVIATGPTLEACRDRLVDVIEEWILVRVARGLAVPPMGGARVEVKRAS